MEFRILGPLEVDDGGRLLELRSQKQRALLAILLLRGGEWVSADALIEALWGGRSPPTARYALHNYIAGLRRTLGPGQIVSHEGGYQLAVEADWVDLNRFERLVEESREADGSARLEKLQEALALWRGPALADLLYEPFAVEEAARLEELHVSALEELADAELSVGEGPELVERLEELVAEHPYRERMRGQLMLALYRSGRQAEALECYRQARETLVGELGIEPGSALRELEQAVLRHDPSLEPPLREERPPIAERRKIVAVLFAELRFAETLDPELRREMSLGTLRHVQAVLEAHGAATEQRGSEELLAVFGLPRAHEDDTLRAARAALELQAEVGEVELRLALESGEVLAGVDETGHGFVAGAVLPAARRLLERTRAGEVLVGPLALMLLGDVAVVHPGAGTGAQLVRLAEPVQVDAPLAGRREELAALHAAFSEVADERRGLRLVILGEAGVGKTRLAAELTSELQGRATIARGRCLSYGQALSYWPLVEVLRSLGDPAREALERLLAGGATSPQQLAWIVHQALARAAAGRPLVVLLEDVHWAEQALLDLLDRASQLPNEAPILLLCLARPELLEQHPNWPLQKILRLEPLPRPDAEALLHALARPPGPEQQDRVLARAAGNPLFLEELSAFLAQGDGGRELPPRIQVLLQARLEQLPEPQRVLLATAALEGTVFHRGALEVLLPPELRAELDEDLAALMQTLLIRPASAEIEREQAFRFRHELIRDTAYGALPKNERMRLHERLADWLEQHIGDRAELEEIAAHHLEQAALVRRELDKATPALDQRAASALAAAAERAYLRTDARAAGDLWTRTLALVDENDPRATELRLNLAFVQTVTYADFEQAQRLLEQAAQRTSDSGVAAAVRLALQFALLYHERKGMSALIRRECADAIPLLEQRGDHRLLARAWLTLAEAEWLDVQMRSAAHAYEEAAAAAALAGDRALEALARGKRAFFLGMTRLSYADAADEFETLCNEFPGEPVIEHGLGLLRAFAALDDGRSDDGRALARPALAYMRRAGWTAIETGSTMLIGLLELLNGNIEEAERCALTSLDELEQHEELAYLGLAKALLANIRVAQGRFHDALALAEESERHLAPDDRFTGVRAKTGRVRAHLGLGEIEKAKAVAEAVVAVADVTDSLDHKAHAQCALAEALAAAEEFPRALEAAEEARRLWAKIDRRLLGQRAEAIGAQIVQAMTAAAVRA